MKRPFATRSYAEVRQVAYMADAAGMLPELREVLLRGDDCLQCDAIGNWLAKS